MIRFSHGWIMRPYWRGVRITRERSPYDSRRVEHWYEVCLPNGHVFSLTVLGRVRKGSRWTAEEIEEIHCKGQAMAEELRPLIDGDLPTPKDAPR